MKILVKQVDWSGWNGGSSSEKFLEYDVKLKKEVVVKAVEYTAVKKSLFQKNSWVEKIFAFKVVSTGDDFVTLQTNGVAGGEYNKDKKKHLSKTVAIKVGETLEFKTNTMDSGSSFYVSIKQ